MAQSAAAPVAVDTPAITPISLKAIAPWAVFFGILMLSCSTSSAPSRAPPR